MEKIARLWSRLPRSQTGFSLIDALVAAAILAAIGLVFMSAMYTGYRSVGKLDEHQQAEVLARSQIEHIKNAPYDESGVYPVTIDLPPHYSMTISSGYPTCIGTPDDCTVLEVDTLQEITISVFFGDRLVLSVAFYKGKT